MSKKTSPSFAFIVKEEIINKKLSKIEIEAFLNGMLFCLYLDKTKPINISIKQPILLAKFNLLVENTSKKFIKINGKKQFQPTNIEFAKPKTANVFLAGAFFASGSISRLTSSSYHLQLCLKNLDNAKMMQSFCQKYLQFNLATNRNQYILYIKKHELISEFLHIIGAVKAYFTFIESVIERDYRNQLTRISNLDIHNQTKLVDSHQLFLKNLEFIEKKNLNHLFTEQQISFYHFKKANPFLPLSQIVDELAKKHQIIKTKGGLNH